jgi:hypothetical protein
MLFCQYWSEINTLIKVMRKENSFINQNNLIYQKAKIVMASTAERTE